MSERLPTNSHRKIALALALLVSGCGARTGLRASPDTGCTDAPVTMDVPTTAPWFDTGIDMEAGQRLRITATGTIHYGGDPQQVTDANGGHFTGKKFFPTAVYPNTIVVSLIGKIGGTEALDTGTPLPEGTPDDGPGFVGTLYDEIVPVSGRLFLGFNDQRQAFGDNVGAFTVTLTPGC